MITNHFPLTLLVQHQRQ